MTDFHHTMQILLSKDLNEHTQWTSMAAQTLKSGGLGYSQFNELLLLMGEDRMGKPFFQFLVDGGSEYNLGSAIASEGAFAKYVEEFRKLSMLHYGSIVFGYREMSLMETENLAKMLEQYTPIDPQEFQMRHDQFLTIQEIPSPETYYLGYVIQNRINKQLRDNPQDTEALHEKSKMDSVISRGTHNQKCYLCSDHMDVYVATSMRETHEYVAVNDFVKEVFENHRLRELKLRYFNPTQAYCSDRIDKGLSEGLMLKRAAMTLYLVQESDTLGKDSELASTLAQGKPVVAYVPRIENPRHHAKEHVEKIMEVTKKTKTEVLLEQFKIFGGAEIWKNSSLRNWVNEPLSLESEVDAATDLLGSLIKSTYDSRANTLTDIHPLGIQVNLETGVANGVLVCRTALDCVELIRRIVLAQMEFTVEEKDGCLLLRETVSSGIFRVVTGNTELTKSFWNFYGV